MKVSGFTFIRNGIIYDFPFVESIKSLLPLVDEMIVNVPESDDDTLKKVKEIGDPKIKIIETKWTGEGIPTGGKVLMYHTDLAFKECTGDWCFYLQADEIVHEKDYKLIKDNMKKYLNDTRVDGLLFNYNHFYGSYDCIAKSRKWYRREVRALKNNPDIKSYSDAQSFRFSDGRKPNAVLIDASIYHYGWARPIEKMREKTKAFDKLWHGDDWDEKNETLTYNENQYGLKRYTGTHPKIMKKRIESQDWKFRFKSSIKNLKDFRCFLSDVLEKFTGRRFFEYKSYRLIKDE